MDLLDWVVVWLAFVVTLNIPIMQRIFIITPICLVAELFDGFGPIEWKRHWEFIKRGV